MLVCVLAADGSFWLGLPLISFCRSPPATVLFAQYLLYLFQRLAFGTLFRDLHFCLFLPRVRWIPADVCDFYTVAVRMSDNLC